MAKTPKKRPYSMAYQPKSAAPKDAKRYLLSGIPAPLWKKFQTRCEREHVAMRQVILQAVEAWTNRPKGSAAVPARIDAPRVTVLPGQLRLFAEDDAGVRSAPSRRTSAAATAPARAPRRRG